MTPDEEREAMRQARNRAIAENDQVLEMMIRSLVPASHALFDAWVAAGFREDQAMTLVMHWMEIQSE